MPIFKKLTSIVDTIDKETGYTDNIDKPYLILYVFYDAIADPETGEYLEGEFKAIRGRKACYKYIMEELNIYNINPLKSFILSGNIVFGNEVSVYTFIRQCIERYHYGDLDIIRELNESIMNISEGKMTEDKINNFFITELNSKARN